MRWFQLSTMRILTVSNGSQSKIVSSVHLREKNSKEEEDLVPTQHVENPPIYPVGIMVTAGSGTLRENWYLH